ncbi:hypothetical protein AB0L25_35720 [Spirillospora sp. NPDC052242]
MNRTGERAVFERIAARLAVRFHGLASAETIGRLVADSYERLRATWWSRSAAAARARCRPASATSTGRSPTRPAAPCTEVRRIRDELDLLVTDLLTTIRHKENT